MRKKLDTRFPAARIKKIMQSDEDVGKIAMAVPLLVSKALELFLQDLCDRTYEITQQRGAKTVSSLHLKQCVHSFNVFDFLREIVSKVPDLGGVDAGGDDRSSSKKRKVTKDEGNHSDEEAKRSKMLEAGPTPTSGKGRGRGRGRGRPRGSHNIEAAQCKSEEDQDITHPSINDKQKHISEGLAAVVIPGDAKGNADVGKNPDASVRGFDLNADLDENGDSPPAPVKAAASSSVEPTIETKDDVYPGWSLSEVEKMAVDPIQLASLNRKIDEDEDDYDEEG